MKAYLFKQFTRNTSYLFILVILFVAGIGALYTGKKFLEKQERIIEKTSQYQKESIDRNLEFHKDDLGLILYYQKFNLVNKHSNLSGMNIGIRDLNPVIRGVTIRNLEEQKPNTDLYNPSNTAFGNFDFVFVLIFVFPLALITLTFNAQSEEVERGTWKMLSIQSQSLKKYLDFKLAIRLLAVVLVYLLLFIIGIFWLDIPLNSDSFLFFISGLLYLIFWALVSRWVASLQKSTAFNALLLVGIWVMMNFIVPMFANVLIEKAIPTDSAVEAFMKQRDGYHNKWDEKKIPTMERFYKVYPQYSHFQVKEDNQFNWTWYYAMHHLGDLEAKPSAEKYQNQLNKRIKVEQYLAYFFPNINTMIGTSQLAKSDMQNELNYQNALVRFHEKKRLEFYEPIFAKKPTESLPWHQQKVEIYKDQNAMSWLKILLPYLILISFLTIISQINYRKL